MNDEIDRFFTGWRIHLVRDDPKLKAVLSCKICEVMTLRGMRLVQGDNGMFLSMPAYKDKDGNYCDHYWPTGKDVRDYLTATAMDLYKRALEGR